MLAIVGILIKQTYLTLFTTFIQSFNTMNRFVQALYAFGIFSVSTYRLNITRKKNIKHVVSEGCDNEYLLANWTDLIYER